MFIDTHCHINLPDSFPDPGPVIEEAQREQVSRMIAVGIDIESSRRALELAEEHEAVFAVVGVHPNSSADYKENDLQELEQMLKHPKAVALGEIGLDYHWDFASKDQQFKALRDQLNLARSLDVPVVFHCREAYPDLLDVLESQLPGPYLLHCFSGDAEDAQRSMQLDCYFGVDGPITYPKANDLRAIVSALPRDRVVVETDSPYLAPAPHRGKPNRPGYVRFVSNGLAAVWKVDPDEAARITTKNAERFFRLP